MKKSEVVKLMEGAIKHVEENNIPKPKFAAWLKERFNISVKDLVLRPDQGFRPYLAVEFLNDDGKVEEAHVDMKRWEEKLNNNKTSFKLEN